MVQEFSEVTKISEVAYVTYLLEFFSPAIARTAAPGQFVNIRVDCTYSPLLRRPMSICDIEGETVKILFNVVGAGTGILARTQVGKTIDVIGPLGHGFDLTKKFDLAVIVAGGLGVAPFPFLTRELLRRQTPIVSFVGARKSRQLAAAGLQNVSFVTDDGSRGFRGTVVELLRSRLPEFHASHPMIFACGPAGMLRALQTLAQEMEVPSEVSLETPMACGIGICQGCPVEMSDKADHDTSIAGPPQGSGKYKLSCKDGPVFDISTIII